MEQFKLTNQEVSENQVEGAKVSWRNESSQLQQLFDRLCKLLISRYNALVDFLTESKATTHPGDFENPHKLTATQINCYTKGDIDNLFDALEGKFAKKKVYAVEIGTNWYEYNHVNFITVPSPELRVGQQALVQLDMNPNDDDCAALYEEFKKINHIFIGNGYARFYCFYDTPVANVKMKMVVV